MSTWTVQSTSVTFEAELQRTPTTRTQQQQLFIVSSDPLPLVQGNSIHEDSDSSGAVFILLTAPQESNGQWYAEIQAEVRNIFVMYKLTDWAGHLVQGTTAVSATTTGAAITQVRALLKKKYSPVDFDYITA